jgi:hypothetical protein
LAISRPIMIASDTDPSLNGAQQLTLAHRCRREGVHPIINLQGLPCQSPVLPDSDQIPQCGENVVMGQEQTSTAIS